MSFAAKMANMKHGANRFTRVDAPMGSSTVSREEAAKLLNESQRAMIAAKLASMKQGTRTDLAPMGAKLVSREEAAKLLNVSENSVTRAMIANRDYPRPIENADTCALH